MLCCKWAQLSNEGVEAHDKTGFSHHHQSKELAEKYIQLVRSLQNKNMGQNLHLTLMLYRSTPMGDSLQSPVEFLYGWHARLDLLMSQTVRMQLGQTQIGHLHTEVICLTAKNWEKVYASLLTIGWHVSFKTSPRKL